MSSNPIIVARCTQPSSRHAPIAAVILALALSVGSAIDALAQDNSNPAVKTEQESKTKGQQCTWACQRWSKMCNVDPRGVYKCRRTCAKFGEVCEE